MTILPLLLYLLFISVDYLMWSHIIRSIIIVIIRANAIKTFKYDRNGRFYHFTHFWFIKAWGLGYFYYFYLLYLQSQVSSLPWREIWKKKTHLSLQFFYVFILIIFYIIRVYETKKMFNTWKHAFKHEKNVSLNIVFALLKKMLFMCIWLPVYTV